MFEEMFDAGILLDPCRSQLREFIEQNGIQRRRFASLSLESRHPDPIPEKEVIQQAMDTAERALPRLPVLRRFQSRALLKQPLVRNPVIAGKHSKVSYQVHSLLAYTGGRESIS